MKWSLKKGGGIVNNRLLPLNINGTDALNSIGENIIIADIDYKIIWLNSHARQSLI
jgi:rsbT co-antagonist protein RsbR